MFYDIIFICSNIFDTNKSWDILSYITLLRTCAGNGKREAILPLFHVKLDEGALIEGEGFTAGGGGGGFVEGRVGGGREDRLLWLDIGRFFFCGTVIICSGNVWYAVVVLYPWVDRVRIELLWSIWVRLCLNRLRPI